MSVPLCFYSYLPGGYSWKLAKLTQKSLLMSTVSVNLKPIKYGKSADLLALNTNKESYDVTVTSHEMLMDRDIFLNPCKLFSSLFDVFVELNSVIGRLI